MSSEIVRPSSAQRDGLYGFLTVALLAAIVRGLIGSGTTVRYLIVAILAAVLVVIVTFWIRLRHRPSRLEIGPDVIEFVDAGPTAARQLLHRTAGGVTVGLRRVDLRTTVPYLRQPGSNTQFDLYSYRVRDVADACRRQGWPVTDQSGRRSRR